MAVYHDCEITLAITNTLDRSIVVYGSEFDQNFDPGKYRLFYNEESQTWEYPTSTKTAAKWESVSSRFKKERRLRPGESLEFSVTLSSNADKGRRFRMTAYVNLSGKGNPLEIVSDEFSSVSCKEKAARVVEQLVVSVPTVGQTPGVTAVQDDTYGSTRSNCCREAKIECNMGAGPLGIRLELQ